MELLFKRDSDTHTNTDIEGMCLAPPDYAQRMVVLSQIALLTGIIGGAYGWTWCLYRILYFPIILVKPNTLFVETNVRYCLGADSYLDARYCCVE